MFVEVRLAGAGIEQPGPRRQAVGERPSVRKDFEQTMNRVDSGSSSSSVSCRSAGSTLAT